MTTDDPRPADRPPEGQILIYRDGAIHLQVRLDGQTVWLPQRLIAELFQVSVPTVNLGNIYEDGELVPEATIRRFRIVQTEGARQVSRLLDHYSLDVILAVGYRVRSQRGTQFRQWATARLGELLVKGFTLDDQPSSRRAISTRRWRISGGWNVRNPRCRRGQGRSRPGNRGRRVPGRKHDADSHQPPTGVSSRARPPRRRSAFGGTAAL